MMTMSDAVQPYSLRPLIRATTVLCTLTLGAVGLWAAFVPLESAVMGAGTVAVEGAAKAIQHPQGGVVSEIAVRDGARVREGDVVLRLDQTEVQAELSRIENRLIEIAARKARLVAERDGTALTFPAVLLTQAQDAETGAAARNAIEDERILMSGRGESLRAKIAQLSERIGQLGNEVAGLSAQKAAAERAAGLVAAEVEDQRKLRKQGLSLVAALRKSEQEAADLEGKVGSLQSDLARKQGEITEVRMQMQQITEDARNEVIEELRKLETERSDLEQKRIAAQDRLARTVLTAPVAGTIHELAVHTRGGVLTAGQTAMSIIPSDRRLMVEVKVSPADIDQVRPGQAVRLRLSAFNQRTTPEIDGTVTSIAADLSQDERSGQSWYLLRVAPDAADLAALHGITLKPGMPVEAFLEGAERTLLSYLLKPISDQMQTALRED